MNTRIIIFLSLALQVLPPKAQAGSFEPIHNPPKDHLILRIGSHPLQDSISTYEQFDHFASRLISFIETGPVDHSFYTYLASAFDIQRNGDELAKSLWVAISLLFVCMGTLILSVKYFS